MRLFGAPRRRLALFIVVSGYWRSHVDLYGPAGRVCTPAITTIHPHDPKHPHVGPEAYATGSITLRCGGTSA